MFRSSLTPTVQGRGRALGRGEEMADEDGESTERTQGESGGGGGSV